MTVKVGIVGLGKMGLLHAGILNALPESSVSSIAEKEGTLSKFAKKLLPGVRFYSNVGDMLCHEELDAVYVTTPISSHLPIMEHIVSSEKKPGVFVEKPLAGNYRDASRLHGLASSRGLLSMVGFQKRFSPIFQRARSMLAEGILGEVTSFAAYSYVSGMFSEGKGWRFKAGQGGALLDLGPHLIDLLMWYFGEPIDIKGSTRSTYSKEVDDSAQGTLRFRTGLVGSFDVSWSVEGYRLPEIGISVTGRNGMLRVTDDYLKVELSSESAGMKAGKHHFQKPEFNSGVDFLIGDPEYCIEDRYFIECILHHKFPEPDFLAGSKVNMIVDEIHNSTLGTGTLQSFESSY